MPFQAAPTSVGDVRNSGIGFAGGIQGGYNWQFGGPFVVGVEADINRLGIKHGYLTTPAGQSRFEVAHDWYATARGRVGYAMGSALVYVTGGVALADTRTSMDFNASPEISTSSRRAPGAVFGGGVEAALGGHWSAKLEYLNVDLNGRARVTDRSPIYYFDTSFQVYRVGLNYRWQPGAP